MATRVADIEIVSWCFICVRGGAEVFFVVVVLSTKTALGNFIVEL